jgi:gas vesicle protein
MIMSNTNSTIAGVLAGLAVGGALGILFAPKSGKETREEIGEKASEMVDKAKKMKEELTGMLSEVSAKEKERIQSYIAQLDDYISDLMKKA